MIVGIPKEIKINENRVGLVVAGVKALVNNGHRVLVYEGAGHGCCISDDAYKAAGAHIMDSPRKIFD